MNHDRILIVTHRIWWLIKIAQRKNIILDNRFVVGGRGAGRSYALRILHLIHLLDTELLSIQYTPPVPNYPLGTTNRTT